MWVSQFRKKKRKRLPYSYKLFFCKFFKNINTFKVDPTEVNNGKPGANRIVTRLLEGRNSDLVYNNRLGILRREFAEKFENKNVEFFDESDEDSNRNPIIFKGKNPELRRFFNHKQIFLRTYKCSSSYKMATLILLKRSKWKVKLRLRLIAYIVGSVWRSFDVKILREAVKP